MRYTIWRKSVCFSKRFSFAKRYYFIKERRWDRTLVNKQEKMVIDAIDDEVAEHCVQIRSNTERILKTEEETIHQAELIKAGIDKDKEQDRLLAEKAEIDAAQDKELIEQRQKDTEHDAKLEKLESEIVVLAEKVKNVIPLKKYRIHMAIVGAFSFIALILAIVGMMM